MSSATVSLFASVALAAVGAAGLAYSLSHPGVFTSVARYAIAETGLSHAGPEAKVQEPVLDEVETDAGSPGTVSIAAGAYGHFLTQAQIDGRSIDVMVDTGASLVALTYEDAKSVGLFIKPSDFTSVAQTANGSTRVAPVTISRISIGEITVRNVPAVVSARGASERTLLGMSFLKRLTRVEMRAGMLVLQE
jgi:aspartyl protease family protein